MIRPDPPSGQAPNPARLPLEAILRPEDYGHHLRLSRGEPAAFFQAWDSTGAVLAERRRWLADHPGRHAPFLPEAAPLVAAAASVLGEPGSHAGSDPYAHWLALATRHEPDLILLTRDAGISRMVAGAVCFPSSWRPQEKLGRPLAFIHDVVPGLNEQLGRSIDTFLGRLQPGQGWFRANWGLTASPELNQHPDRELPRLTGPAALAATLLRVEHQALTALPGPDGILFGIRVEHVPLQRLASQPAVAMALARALRSMPEAMARYKGIDLVAAGLAAALEQMVHAGPPPPSRGRPPG